ncbi:hypothetical protein [Thioalkalivibrio sp. ALE16]|uniref:hypothetical protein n=1 Tax=Thioalkalivibrio sp. ALE16 TaxID=1158172 RepID=UPI000371471B|nr:hypothetical protein [Thioalkalivibrio sp. ALE16]
MSLQSDCDIDPSDIDGLDIPPDALPNTIMAGEETIVRKVDETTCLVAYAVQDSHADCPQDSWDMLGRVVLLDCATDDDLEGVRKALGAESVHNGEITALPWEEAREEFTAEKLSDIEEKLAERFLERYREILEHEWFKGIAPQRVIPKDWFLRAVADDADTQEWLINRFGETANDPATIQKLAERAWTECRLKDVPVTTELLSLAKDLGRRHVEEQSLKRFSTHFIKTAFGRYEDDDRFIDEVWRDLFEAENPLRDPDLVELGYRTNGGADPIDLSVKNGFSEDPKAFVLLNKDGREELDDQQRLEAFSRAEYHGSTVHVEVYPEFREALGLDDAPLEFKDMTAAQVWRKNVLEGRYFSLTPSGVEWGRAQARRAIAESLADLYEGWANGDVYGYVIERCDYDSNAGEWVYTDQADSLWEIHGASGLEMNLREGLEDQTRQIRTEKAQAEQQAA